MKELFKVLTEYLKARRQYMKDIKRLEQFEINMEAFQRIVDMTRLGEAEVVITIHLANGNSITVERKGEGNKFKSFQEKWAESRAARG